MSEWQGPKCTYPQFDTIGLKNELHWHLCWC